MSTNGTQDHIAYLDTLAAHRRKPGRPFVTLSYAQSLDGCLSGAHRRQYSLSGEEALAFTHRLRAWHDAILVGIGTVTTDDPHLTVRHVSGRNPQPVVLDSTLRFPLTAYLLGGHPMAPWIMTTLESDIERERVLTEAGAKVFRLQSNENGRVAAGAALEKLAGLGIERVMVEGGAGIIGSFLVRRLVDVVIITISPMIVGGVRAIDLPGDVAGSALPTLSAIRVLRMGKDMVLIGEPRWED
ncbi:MAG: RibD family protein [bacterium]|nr:MAG: RibD family protein [bacterium]